MRIGYGFDVHAFGPGDHVMLGGVKILHHRGVAHSDVACSCTRCATRCQRHGRWRHGQHFPDTDPK
jgi:2-C-methyl-D-erythritol 2,4-cyclodiphosphate synthase